MMHFLTFSLYIVLIYISSHNEKEKKKENITKQTKTKTNKTKNKTDKQKSNLDFTILGSVDKDNQTICRPINTFHH